VCNHWTPPPSVKLAPALLFGAVAPAVVPEFCAVNASPYDWHTSPAVTTSPGVHSVHPRMKTRDRLARRIRHVAA
jgi:hypothetical protein